MGQICSIDPRFIVSIKLLAFIESRLESIHTSFLVTEYLNKLAYRESKPI